MCVTILYTKFSYSIYESLLERYQNILPESVKEKVFKFRRWQDRQAFLLGKLLIWKGLKQFKYGENCLTKLQFNNYGKPFIDQKIHFNLSHSGDLVICAFFNEEVGIDVEEIKEIEVDDFNYILTQQEKKLLKDSSSQTKDFFRFWTMKESIIKAEGKGLSIPLHLINTSDAKQVLYEQNTWFLNELHCFKNYCCSFASKSKNPPITLINIDFHTETLNLSF